MDPMLADEIGDRRRLHRSVRRWSIGTSLLEIFGCAAVSAGVWLIWMPAGLIVSGVLGVGLAYVLGPEASTE